MKKHISIVLVASIACLMLTPIFSYANTFDNDGTFDYEEKISYAEMNSEDLINYEQKVIYAPANPAKSKIDVVQDDDANVLQWTTSDFTKRNLDAKLTIPLENSFNINDGPFSLEFRAKLPANSYRWINKGFMNFETAETKAKDTIDPALMFGLGQYSGDFFSPVANKSVYFLTNINSASFKLMCSKYFDKYYTYRFDVDPENATYRFYCKADDEQQWTEPYAELKVLNPYTTDDTTDTFEKGVIPTGALPADDIVALSLSSGCYIAASNPSETEKEEAKKEVSYYISDIKISQIKVPVIESISIADGEKFFKPNNNINIAFKSQINAQSVNYDNVYIAKILNDGTKETVAHDIYTVNCDESGKNIVLSFNDEKQLDYLTEYKLHIKDIESNSEGRGKLGNPIEINFRTVGQYEINVNQFNITDRELKKALVKCYNTVNKKYFN